MAYSKHKYMLDIITITSQITHLNYNNRNFPGGAVVKNLPANAGDTVRALVREDPTCCGATKPVHHY